MAAEDSKSASEQRVRAQGAPPPELGTRVATIAHEINNPITYVLSNLGELQQLALAMREAIAGYREWARSVGEGERSAHLQEKIDQAGGVELIEELAGDALEGAERIRALAGELLALVRGTQAPSAQIEALDLCDIVHTTVRVFARDLPADVRVEQSLEGHCCVRGERGPLAQIFTNLLENARDACTDPAAPLPPDGHRIAVRCSGGHDGHEGVWVDVADTGLGIPREQVQRIFERFFTTKPPGRGTGLGLYISRGLVEGHGGRLELLPSPHGGARFRVWLPSFDASGAHDG